MTRFLLSVWHDGEYVLDFSTPEAQRTVAAVGRFNTTLKQEGALVLGGGLQPASSATVARPDGERASLEDEPYAGAAPQMGGFWIIEASDREAALEWARRAAVAAGSAVEVRQLEG